MEVWKFESTSSLAVRLSVKYIQLFSTSVLNEECGCLDCVQF